MLALVFNPGSASLKFDLVELEHGQRYASLGQKKLSASIEEMGKSRYGTGARLLVFDGREIRHTEDCPVKEMAAGAAFALEWLQRQSLDGHPVKLASLAFIGVRVVHGGPYFHEAAVFTPDVAARVEELETLAPLHNRNSLLIRETAQKQASDVRVIAAFDTAFHSTLPEIAWRYPIHRETADRHGIRKFGFHGLSHRYMLETYAQAVGKAASEITVVTLHMESGSSACAIRNGQSVDTTMGLTPLEGLMMGTRSGSIDPAIVPYLMQQASMTPEDVMTLLNKKSGLLGIAGQTLDTRELVKRSDDAAKLAMAMFSYRVRLAVGAYLAALGDAEAVLFGGGIGENTPSVRADVCAGLRGWGLHLDEALNTRSTSGQVCLTLPESRLHAWAMPVEEGLQIAHECMQVAS